MSWKIQIEGDEKYLEDLRSIIENPDLDNLGLVLEKYDKSYFLQWKRFDCTTNAKEIASKLKTLLTLMSATSPFKSERAIKQFEIVRIFYEDKNIEKVFDSEGNLESCTEISEDGKKSIHMYLGSGSIKLSGSAVSLAVSNDGKILGGLNTIESVKRYIEKDSKLSKNLADYLKPFFENLVDFSLKFSDETPTKDIIEAESKYGKNFELAKWTALRKIYETIRDDNYFKGTAFKSGFSFIIHIIGKETADDLYLTACNTQLHSETTTEERKYKEPSRIITLSEAEELKSTLLLKYIEEKTKEI